MLAWGDLASLRQAFYESLNLAAFHKNSNTFSDQSLTLILTISSSFVFPSSLKES